ncbi:glycogen debranching enzyme GlgX, partial [Pseudomonas fragi]|nr:glycogen debranching enzyme GlgX [Pseudomonas fragi]
TPEFKVVSFKATTANEMTTEQWEDAQARCMGMLLDGRAQVSGVQRAGADATLLIVVNANHDPVSFTLPKVPHGISWSCRLDTTDPSIKGPQHLPFNKPYEVTGRSLVLFELQHTEVS